MLPCRARLLFFNEALPGSFPGIEAKRRQTDRLVSHNAALVFGKRGLLARVGEGIWTQHNTGTGKSPFVAEVFTGSPGKYVGLAETIRGFQLIISGELDGLPAFYLVGTIDDATGKAMNLSGEP